MRWLPVRQSLEYLWRHHAVRPCYMAGENSDLHAATDQKPQLS